MKNIVLEGNKVVLKYITEDDISKEYLNWLNDEHVVKGLDTVPQPYTMSMLRAYVENILNNENIHMFMVLDKESKENIGTAKIHNISLKNGTCNLGLMLGNKKFWGKGYGQDAYNTVIDYVFRNLKIRKIWELANEDNIASLSMCKRAGFQIEGHLKKQVLSEGKYIDKIVLGLFADNWKK